MKRTIPALGFGVAWLAALVFAQAKVLQYEATPARAATPSVSWPVTAAIKPASGTATLVLLAHPQCPCTRATMTELEKIMARSQGRLQVRALFYKPRSMAAGWEKTGLWYRAAAMTGVTPVVDEDGTLARQFGLHTSGEVAVFGTKGDLQFQGGITQGRGHEGDNAGSEAVIALAATGHATVARTPVFGCAVLPVENPQTNSVPTKGAANAKAVKAVS